MDQLDTTADQIRAEFEQVNTARDHAYHQGTVWPWLLGPYGRACLHLRSRSELLPPAVTIVEPGTYHAARVRRIRSLRGRVGAPVVRVVDHARAPIFPATTVGHVRG